MEHVKKLALLAPASAKALNPLPPPHELLADIASFFYKHKYICFWNKKGLKWMIFTEKKNLAVKEKYFEYWEYCEKCPSF